MNYAQTQYICTASSHMSFDVFAGILKMSFLDWQSHNTAASALVRDLRLYTYRIPYLPFSHVATNRSVICDSTCNIS